MRQTARSKAASFGPMPISHGQRFWLAGWRAIAAPDIAGWARGQADQRRLFLLAPIALICGILLYFSADGEPSIYAPMVAFGAFALSGYLLRHYFLARTIAIGLMLSMLGFAAAALRTDLVAAPRLSAPIFTALTGDIISVERSPSSTRLLMSVETLDLPDWAKDKPDFARPDRVRVTLRKPAMLAAGDRVSLRARLMPPAEPALPGGYDFEREAYFQRIGAVGTVAGEVTVTSKAATGDWSGLIDRARNTLTERIATVIGGQAGALSAALITGKRSLLTEDTNDDLRASGLYHIVSISGLHMVLVAGALFFFVRAGLALWPTAALRWPIKKMAALASLIGTAAYCIFSGAEVATIRSLIMTGVMLGAILIDRPALSMRNVAIAAFIILLLEPETLLGPSFQMSFAAVMALIAAHESWSAWRRHSETRSPKPALIDKPGFFTRQMQRTGAFVIGLAATTLVATAATAPFGIEHFQKVNSFGLIGNLLAVPLVSFIVMPAAVAGTLLYPFGLDRPVWLLMGEANDLVIRIAAEIGSWPHASLALPASGIAFLWLVTALLMASLPIGRARWLFIGPAVLGMGLTATVKPPDIMILPDASSVLVRDGSGMPVLLGRSPGDFVLDQWRSATGLSPDAKLTRAEHLTTCDRQACILVLPQGTLLSYVTEAGAFAEDCRKADIVVTPLAAPVWCRPRQALVDIQILKQKGATSLTEMADGSLIHSVRANNAPRPWQAARGPSAQ